MNNEKFDKIAYNKVYNKANYKEMKIRLKKDDYEKIVNYCKDMNISRNGFMVKIAKYVIDNDIYFSEIDNNY